MKNFCGSEELLELHQNEVHVYCKFKRCLTLKARHKPFMLLEETESTLWEQHVSHRNNKISSFVTTVIVPKRARDDRYQKNKFLRTEKFLFSCTSLYLWIKISSCLIKNRKTKLFSFFSQTAIMLKDFDASDFRLHATYRSVSIFISFLGHFLRTGLSYFLPLLD